jgi:hypothetical protein
MKSINCACYSFILDIPVLRKTAGMERQVAAARKTSGKKPG